MNDVVGRFMVLGLTGLVLRDLIDTMKSNFPALEVSIAANEVEAAAQIAEASAWKYAFLNLGAEALIACELPKLFVERGAKVVLLGSAAEDVAADCCYPVLIRPYMADDILRMLG